MTIQRINGSRGHWYRIDGVKADGVTTLLKNGLPKPALTYWSAKCVAEHVADATDDDLRVLRDLGRDGMIAALKGVPWKKRDDAAVRGTAVHNLAEKLVVDEEVEVPEHLVGHVDACLNFFADWKVQPISVERTVGHRKWRYCGTYDLVGDLVTPGEIRAPWLPAPIPAGTTIRALVDYKTAASGIWPDTALQLAAYQHAETYVDPDGTEQPMAALGIELALAVHLRADGYDVYPLDTSEQVFKHFLHIAWVARHCVGDPVKTLLGSAVQPAAVETENVA